MSCCLGFSFWWFDHQAEYTHVYIAVSIRTSPAQRLVLGVGIRNILRICTELMGAMSHGPVEADRLIPRSQREKVIIFISVHTHLVK